MTRRHSILFRVKLRLDDIVPLDEKLLARIAAALTNAAYQVTNTVDEVNVRLVSARDGTLPIERKVESKV